MSLLAISMLFVGCTQSIIALNPEAKGVRIVTNEPSNCEYLGEVYGYQSSTSLDESQVTQSAINSAKNEAYKLGGDTLHFLSNQQNTSYISGDSGFVILDSSAVSVNKSNLIGLVYKCNQN